MGEKERERERQTDRNRQRQRAEKKIEDSSSVTEEQTVKFEYPM